MHRERALQVQTGEALLPSLQFICSGCRVGAGTSFVVGGGCAAGTHTMSEQPNVQRCLSRYADPHPALTSCGTAKFGRQFYGVRLHVEADTPQMPRSVVDDVSGHAAARVRRGIAMAVDHALGQLSPDPDAVCPGGPGVTGDRSEHSGGAERGPRRSRGIMGKQ